MIVVSHRTPLHDNMCRCRTCKPSPVGHGSDQLRRLEVGLIGLGSIGIALLAAIPR